MRQWKHICIFVSSTFRDMDVERDALRSLVEPRLNQYLADYMVSVEFVDLRHSVKTNEKSSEEEREKQICSVCFNEIDRCAPYFIGLLGHRYGWIPPKGVVSNDCLNVLPINEHDLSVTLHEYNRGLFSKTDNVNGCVFIRKEESYRNLNTEETIALIDGGKEMKYLESMRKYVLTNDKIKSLEYDLDLGNITTASIGEWVDMVYKTMIDILAPECDREDKYDELTKFQSSHERFVQRKIRSFKGRQEELNEFSRKMESRNGCILAEKEYGTGMHSFMCAAYDRYRQNPNNVCLFYSSQSSIGQQSFPKVMYFWVELLNKDYIKENVSLDETKDDLNLLTQKFNGYIQTLKQQGKDVYVFICDELYSLPKELASADIKLSHLCLYTDKVESLRPLMYILEPFKKETICKIVEPLRPKVRSRLMTHPRSVNAGWLAMATMQLDRLDKMDFLSIRNNSGGDEASIIKYQLEMIDTFDFETSMMLSKWYLKICNYLGRTLIDKIIYTLGLIQDGMPANLCCSIVNCSLTEFTLTCHALGEDIVCEKENGLWGLHNLSFLSSTIAEMSDKDKADLHSAMESLVDMNPYLTNSALKIHILTGNVNRVAKSIESYHDYNELRTTTTLNDFIWIGTFIPDKLKEFFTRITLTSDCHSYTFLYRIINCIKELRFEPTQDVYLEIILMLKEWFLEQWKKRRVDSMTHSLLGDVIACAADAYYMQSDRRGFDAELEYGISYSEAQMKKNSHWTNPYLYYIYRKISVHNHQSNFETLRSTIGPMERNRRLTIPKGEDTTIYAIILVETYKYYVANGKFNVMHLAQKSIDLFIAMVDGHENTNTTLKPVDLIRNLLYNMHIILTINENSPEKVLSENWIQEKGWEVVRKCKSHKNLFKHDLALYYYYDLIGKLVKYSSDKTEKKVHDLYAHIFEVVESHYSSYINFAIMTRNSSEVSSHFAAYVSLMSALLQELSITDGNTVPSAEWIECRKTAGIPDLVRKETHLCFAEELKFILPLIGAKNLDSEDSCAHLLKEPLALLYESMINVQLSLHHPDRDVINKLYNSFCTVNGSTELSNLLPRRLTVIDRDLMLEILDEFSGDYSSYEDYSDCFGMEGDAFLNMWLHGDPNLEFKLAISDDPDEYTLSRRELENSIENTNYKSIISKIGKRNKLSVYEAYYLGLALLRTDEYDHAFKVMRTLTFTEFTEGTISSGEAFSIITNYLISCLLSHHFEEYIEVYSNLSEDDSEDEDISGIHEAYLACMEEGGIDVHLEKPYGFIL